MLGLVNFLASTAIGQVVRRLVDKILSKLGIGPITDGSEDKERMELIHALARAQREQTEQRQQTQTERNEREELEERLEQQRRVIDLMDRRGYDREMLIRRYEEDSELYVLLVAAADKDAEEGENSYLKDKLNEEYDAESIAGALKIIPPHQIPESITSDEDVEDWTRKIVENQPGESPPSGIYLATRKNLEEIYSEIDTKNFDNGWKTASEVVDQVLGPDDLQGLINSAPVSPVSLVQDGDLLFLAHGALPDAEIQTIDKYQSDIADDLSDPSLRELAEEISVDGMATKLEPYTDSPEKTASSLLDEAERIHRQLTNSEAVTTF